MSSLRFATLRDLYESFPTAEDDIKLPASDQASLTVLQGLIAKQSWFPAVAFCAYLLPRREAIWWGCECVRRLQPELTAKETAALELVEAWVHDPNDDRRRQALDLGTKGDGMVSATWLLLAVGWSGGSLIAPQHGMVPAAPQQTARAVSGGVTMALARLPKSEAAKMAKPCFDSAIALATGQANS